MACVAAPACARPVVSISAQNGTAKEQETCAAIRSIIKDYALGDWLYTREVVVDENVIPHSHPVLTLNTEWRHDRVMLLAELLHEQLHWFAVDQAVEGDRAIADTYALYPKVPDGPPEGARDERSTRLHLIVCYLEYLTLTSIVGPEAATKTIQRTGAHHYHWIYAKVLTDGERIDALVRRHGLLPRPLARHRTSRGT